VYCCLEKNLALKSFPSRVVSCRLWIKFKSEIFCGGEGRENFILHPLQGRFYAHFYILSTVVWRKNRALNFFLLVRVLVCFKRQSTLKCKFINVFILCRAGGRGARMEGLERMDELLQPARDPIDLLWTSWRLAETGWDWLRLVEAGHHWCSLSTSTQVPGCRGEP
jgi:hypothetical protein